MGEIEGLDTHEPLPERIDRHAFDRLIMLSDGVFAIAITLAALEIRPRGPWRDLPTLWEAVRLSVFAYALSFSVISAYWASHRDTFARLERVDAPFTVLTLGLLASLAVLPTTTRLVYEDGASGAVQLYCLSLVAVGLFQAAMWAYASVRPGLMKAEVPRAYRAGRVLVALFVPGFFLVMAGMTGRGFSTGIIYGAAAMAAAVAVVRRTLLPWLERRSGRRAPG